MLILPHKIKQLDHLGSVRISTCPIIYFLVPLIIYISTPGTVFSVDILVARPALITVIG